MLLSAASLGKRVPSPAPSLAPSLAALLVAALATPLGAPATGATGRATAEASVDRTVRDPRVTESSGLARSGYARPVLFTHNDSGDVPAVYAVARTGVTRAVLHLRGASAVDWEDISRGPRRTLWIGDIGDNDARRSTISVYRIRERRTLRTGAVGWVRFDLAYPDGPRDAEGLLVHPRTGRLFVVSKQGSGAGVYRAPRSLSTTRVNRMTRIAGAPAVVTAASFSPDGRRVVMSDYQTAFVKRFPTSRVLRRVRLPSTAQGESIEFTRNGRGLLRGSEGERSPIWRVPLG